MARAGSQSRLSDSLSQSTIGGVLASIDLDDNLRSGIYWVHPSCSNKPNTNAGLMINHSWNNGIRGVQIYDDTTRLFHRTKLNENGWTSWLQISL